MDETSTSRCPVLTEAKTHESRFQKEHSPIPSISSELEQVGNMENEMEKKMENLMMKQMHNKGQRTIYSWGPGLRRYFF
jgi:hypothetical protein